jgi:hypothetical protein
MLGSWTRRHRTGLVASTVLALAVTLPAQASAQTPVPCRPGPGTTTIAHSRYARLFEDAHTDAYYACLYTDGHARELSDNEHYGYALVRFAGPYVAFVQSIESAESDVGVVNLRTGHAHYHEELAAPIEASVCPEVGSLGLSPDGAVAWIATNFLGEVCGPEHDRSSLGGPLRAARAGQRTGDRLDVAAPVRLDDRVGRRRTRALGRTSLSRLAPPTTFASRVGVARHQAGYSVDVRGERGASA